MTAGAGSPASMVRVVGDCLVGSVDVDVLAARVELLAALTHAVPGAVASTCSVRSGTAIRPGGHVADTEVGAAIDLAQVRAGEGPALDAARSGESVWTGDVRTDDRWPALRRAVGAPVQVAAALSVPLTLRRGQPVVITVYAEAGTFTTSSVVRALGVVDDLRVALAAVDLHEEILDLQSAVQTNRAIGAAVGILMARHLLSYDEAAAVLKRVSNNTNRKVADLADHVVQTGDLPHPP